MDKVVSVAAVQDIVAVATIDVVVAAAAIYAVAARGTFQVVVAVERNDEIVTCPSVQRVVPLRAEYDVVAVCAGTYGVVMGSRENIAVLSV